MNFFAVLLSLASLAASAALNECRICLSGIENEADSAAEVACHGNLFHRDCLNRWTAVKATCPICAAALPVRDEVIIRRAKQSIFRSVIV